MHAYMQGIEPGSPVGEMPECWPLHYPDIRLGVDFNKVYSIIKKSNFTNPSLPQIEMIDIGHKAYLLLWDLSV